jgi:uncharacterized protein YkwD
LVGRMMDPMPGLSQHLEAEAAPVNRTKTHRLRPAFDPLDQRCLLAGNVTASLAAGVLTINGTDAADVITVNVASRANRGNAPAGNIVISGVRQKFRIQKVSQIVINAGAGDDVIAVNARGPASIPARIDGGAGADTVNGVREIVAQAAPAPSSPAAPAPTVTATPVAPAPAIPASSLVQRIADLTNAERQKAGLAPVRVSDPLTAAAQHLADDMARLDTLSHTLPGTDAPTLKDRADRVGYAYSWLGENIAFNYAGADEVVAGWMSSAGHRANILNPNFTEIGIGVARDSDGEPYYAQIFGRPA